MKQHTNPSFELSAALADGELRMTLLESCSATRWAGFDAAKGLLTAGCTLPAWGHQRVELLGITERRAQ